MNLFDVLGYPLIAIAALEIVLGIILLRQNPRNSPVNKSVAAFSLFAGIYVLSNGISYILAGRNQDFNFFNRFAWIGWFMVPAGIQFVYFLKDEKSRAARIIGYVLYPFWGVIFLLTMTTRLVEPGDASLIPYKNLAGPLENPMRLIGMAMIVWLMVEILKLKKQVTGIKKTQLNYFFHGTLIFAAGGALIVGLLPVFSSLNPALGAYFSLPWVAITYYAITRKRLFDLRLLVSRVLIIAFLSIFFATLNIALFEWLSPSLGDPLAILLSLAVIGLILFGTRLSGAVQNFVQRMVLRNKYDYQHVLKESIKAIVTILNQDELLAYLIHSIKQGLDVESICLALKMEGGQFAQLYGSGAFTQEKQEHPITDDILEWLRRADHVLVREELGDALAGDKNAILRAYMEEGGVEIIVPLVYKGDLKGIIMLGLRGNREPYVKSDIDLLDMLAGHAAVAIENARLYEEARSSRESYLASEAKFRTLADSAAFAIFIHQGGNFLYANHAAEIIGGYTIAEYLTMDFMSLVHPDYIDMIKARARERLGGGEAPPQYEFKIIRKDGEERWVLMTAGVTNFEGKPSVIGTLIDITARKHAEEEWHRMSLMVENSSDFIGIAGMDSHLLYVNQAGRKLIGLDSDADITAMSADDLYFPEDRAELRDYRQRKHDWRGEFRLRHLKTGAAIPVEWYVFMVHDKETGKPIGRAAVMRDIADLKHAREERERYYQQLQDATQSLRESEAKFRSLAETAPAAIFIHQGKNFLFANKASSTILGYSREELLSMDFWGVTYPEDKEMVIKRGKGRVKGESAPERYELRVVTKSDEVRWLDMTITVIDYEGKPAVLGTAFDITDRIRVEKERELLNIQLQQALHSLQESEAKFRTLAETTTAAIFIHQGQKLVYANSAGEAMTGYSREELLQEDFWALIHPDYQEIVKERGQSRMQDKNVPKEYEFKFLRKDGDERWAATTAGVIEFGNKPAVIATLFDITDWKLAEEAKVRFYEESVKQYRERMEEEKRHRLEKEKILMDLHDGIGGITTNISILSEVARKSTDAETISNALSTISRLSREGISEIRGFMHSLDSKELNWRTLAVELRNQGMTMVEPHKIKFAITTDLEDVEEQPGSLVWANLFRIYREALTNVIKHSKADAVNVVFHVRKAGVALSVADNGVGQTSGRDGGRGQANMKTRAGEIGGSVKILTEKGTRVSFELPLPLKYPAEGMAI